MTTYVIVLIAVIIIGIPAIILVNKLPKLRVLIQALFAILIVALSVLLVQNINKPIKFEKELDKRTAATIEKLIDIKYQVVNPDQEFLDGEYKHYN